MISFKGKHFLKPIILMSIRWYLAYALSYRNIEELLLERGLNIDHSTINRWVVEYSPQLLSKFKNRKKIVTKSWCMDETYVKVKGKWMYQYRAVDKAGMTVDFYFSRNRNKKAAIMFFKNAISTCGKPNVVNIDKSGSNLASLKAINKTLPTSKRIKIRQNKYLNNLVEQDHRFVKKIIKPMLGFKSEIAARATLDGIELHHMLRKGQNKNLKTKTIFEQFFSLAA